MKKNKKPGPKPKPICRRGHDTRITGKNRQGACKVCAEMGRKKYRERIRKGHKIKFRVRICPKGHDKKVVGLNASGGCMQCQRDKNRIWRLKNLDIRRNFSLVWLYGITSGTYKLMLKNQNSSCAGCLRNYKKLSRKLFVDHDHSCCPTTKTCGRCIRGLLCDNCNRILGNCNDDINILLRLVKYLKMHKKSLATRV